MAAVGSSSYVFHSLFPQHSLMKDVFSRAERLQECSGFELRCRYSSVDYELRIMSGIVLETLEYFITIKRHNWHKCNELRIHNLALNVLPRRFHFFDMEIAFIVTTSETTSNFLPSAGTCVSRISLKETHFERSANGKITSQLPVLSFLPLFRACD